MSETRKFAVLFMLLVFSLSAFAVQGSAKFDLSAPVQLNGHKLDPGTYKATWTGEGDKIQVNLTAGKKINITATAKIVELPRAPMHDAVVNTTDGKLKEIHFSGKKTSLVFAE